MAGTTFAQQLETLRSDLILAREELVRAVGRVPPELFGLAPRGEWSAEGVLRHLVKSEHLYALGVDVLRGRAPDPAGADLDRLLGPAEALRALEASRRRLLAALEGVTEDQFYEMRQLGLNEESIKSILENVAMHDREHAQQLEKTVAEARAEAGE